MAGRRGRPAANARGNDAGANQSADAEREAQEQAQREAAEADDEDESEDGGHEPGDAPDDDPDADLASVSNVDHDADSQGPQEVYRDAETGDGLAVGSALSTGQQTGLDPVDVTRHVEQASDRKGLTNAQTDHERDNALDAVSGTSSPGITRNHGHSAPGKLGASDMSGRKPFPDVGNAGTEVRAAMAKLQEASRVATSQRKRGHGYLNLRELGVNKAVLDALVAGGHVTKETRPGGTFNPETGVVYRIASHKEPEIAPKEDA